ncbi:MAG TPA: aminodeoxychorismate/anthranilate synthase component II [Bacteroidota bacterium]|nr:aminodeoxychorismate/anthranilate synthase component II [Bacteroidota bacterium]
MILLVDNYDSFTYNLAHLFGMAGKEVKVVRNDAIRPGDVGGMTPEGIVLSPGPGRPETAGVIVELVRRYGGSIPILGICLGHQAIGYAYGADIIRHEECVHGRSSPVFHGGEDIFRAIDNPFEAGRYHSLVISRHRLPDCLRVTAETPDGTIMGVRHVSHPVRGLQFHPESILTPAGRLIIENWLAPPNDR